MSSELGGSKERLAESSYDRDETEAFVEAGMQVDPAYIGIYAAMPQYLLPRWHGEPGDLEQFAADVAKRLPGDDGLEAYGKIAFEVSANADSLRARRSRFRNPRLPEVGPQF